MEIVPEIKAQRRTIQEANTFYMDIFRPYIIREARRILKVGGRLLLNNLCYIKREAGWEIGDDITHVLTEQAEINQTPLEGLPLKIVR